MAVKARGRGRPRNTEKQASLNVKIPQSLRDSIDDHKQRNSRTLRAEVVSWLRVAAEVFAEKAKG